MQVEIEKNSKCPHSETNQNEGIFNYSFYSFQVFFFMLNMNTVIIMSAIPA